MRYQHIQKHIEKSALKMLKISGKSTRFSLPFGVKCSACNNILAKNTRFNSVRKTIGRYSGVEIYRFYIKCRECKNFLCVDTDPKNSCYKPGPNTEINSNVTNLNVTNSNVTNLNEIENKCDCEDPYDVFIGRLKKLLIKRSDFKKMEIDCKNLMSADVERVLDLLQTDE